MQALAHPLNHVGLMPHVTSSDPRNNTCSQRLRSQGRMSFHVAAQRQRNAPAQLIQHCYAAQVSRSIRMTKRPAAW